MNNRYFIELSYRGTNFHGWQIQENANSVQAELNRALNLLLKEDISTLGAGRTDTGVHAKYFIAHFDTARQDLNDNPSFIYHLNKILPNDISVKAIRAVKPETHARFDAISRTYHYYMCRDKDPFWQELAWLYHGSLNIDLMQKAADTLFNYDDFTSFSKVGSDNKTSICKIATAKWEAKDNLLIFEITADRFLRNMVRAIVGTLVEVGREKTSIERFEEIIAAKNRSLAGTSAPAEGLYLTHIKYPDSIYQI
ncbi:MAG TPA: tRNA pseudouridine(38-40) synthase TruA [Bacteroidales bacterium]|nr:tRNA pseudouridine(38-40) synthase TruA [Bacteroidales bacterium]